MLPGGSTRPEPLSGWFDQGPLVRQRLVSVFGRDVAEVDTVGTDQRRMRTTFRLATSGRAVTGELAGCSPMPIQGVAVHTGQVAPEPSLVTPCPCPAG